MFTFGCYIFSFLIKLSFLLKSKGKVSIKIGNRSKQLTKKTKKKSKICFFGLKGIQCFEKKNLCSLPGFLVLKELVKKSSDMLILDKDNPSKNKMLF